MDSENSGAEIISDSDSEFGFRDGTSISSYSSTEHHRMKIKINSSGKDVPSTSLGTVAKKKKKKEKKILWHHFCNICHLGLYLGDVRKHCLGRRHTDKAICRLKKKSCITVMGFNPETTSKDMMYDYFSVVGIVETVVYYKGEEWYAYVKFRDPCCVDHAAACLTVHRLNDSELKVTKGLRFGKKPYWTQSESERESIAKNFVPAKKVEMVCKQCKVTLNADNSRKHYLSRSHTVKAYPHINAKHCITVTGFHPDTSVKALYDHFSRPGIVITILMLREKKASAVVEFLQSCSVVHARKCLVRHIIGKNKLTVYPGFPSRGNLPPEVPDFLSKYVPLEKELIGTGPVSKYSACAPDNTFRSGRCHSQNQSQTCAEQTVPFMRESSCITVTGFPAELTIEELNDYFNNFEKVKTIDSRRQEQGLIVVEFESEHPLQNIVESVTTQIFRNSTFTIIRGCPPLDVPVQSPVSHKKEEKEKPLQPKHKTVDRVVQNELENAMKSLRRQKPSAKTVVEDHAADHTKISSTSNEKKEVMKKPVFCDVCNSFYNSEATRHHHISKKHNQNAMQYMNKKCCLSVKGFFKDTRLKLLYECFRPFGKVKAVVVYKKELMAMVEFYDESSADRALYSKTPLFLKSRKLSVRCGHPKYNGGRPLENLPHHAAVLDSVQKCKTIHDQMLSLQSSVLLSKRNWQARMRLWRYVKAVLLPFFPNCALHLFGSSVNSFGLKGSDVDLLFEANRDKPDKVESEVYSIKSEIKSPSILESGNDKFSAARLESLPKISQLDFIKKLLRDAPQEFSTVVLISSAACPIVKFVSKRYGLSCDISNGNRMSLCNTELLRLYGRLDKRVIPLVTTLRYWAKIFNYISSHNFSSYAFTLMVIFFLQTRDPPILPSVKLLRHQSDTEIMVGGYDCSFCSDVRKIERSTNSQTLESLLVEFFSYYGAYDFSKFVLSPLTGCCEPIEHFNSDDDSSVPKFKVSPVCIQDPFLICRNVSSFVKEIALTQMTDHCRKISIDHKIYVEDQEKSKAHQCTEWGIPQMFKVMPNQMKNSVPKKQQKVNSFTMVKIALTDKILDTVKNKYEINCTQCIDIVEIVIHEICISVINVLHALLFDVEITEDKKNHCEWKEKVQTLQCSCGDSCKSNLKSSSIGDEVPTESEAKKIEVSDSFHSADVSSSVVNEKLAENCVVINNGSCSADLNSTVSGNVQDERKENCLAMSGSSCISDPSSSVVSALHNENLVENHYAIGDNYSSAGLNIPIVSGDVNNDSLVENCLAINDSSSVDLNSPVVSDGMQNEIMEGSYNAISDNSCSADINIPVLSDDVKNERLAENCHAVNNNSYSADLKSERLAENCYAVNNNSCLTELDSSHVSCDVKNETLAENSLSVNDSSCSADLNSLIISGDKQNEILAGNCCAVNNNSCSTELDSSHVSCDVKNERLAENGLAVNDPMCSADLNSLIISCDKQNERMAENCYAVNNSCSAELDSPYVSCDVENERLQEHCLSVSDSSCSADLNSSIVKDDVQIERQEENCLEVDNSSRSVDSSSEDSNDGHFSDEESKISKIADAKMSDALSEAHSTACTEKKSAKCFVDMNDYEPFLCVQFTAAYQTWVCRNKYKKEGNIDTTKTPLEFEKCISERITKNRSLKLEHPGVFKCEFYEYHKGVPSVLFLKVTPPELKRCWVPLTSFLKLYLPKMVESTL